MERSTIEIMAHKAIVISGHSKISVSEENEYFHSLKGLITDSLVSIVYNLYGFILTSLHLTVVQLHVLQTDNPFLIVSFLITL